MNNLLKKFYVVSCGIMAVISVLALILTVYIGTGGPPPAESPFWNAAVLVSLITFGALTVLCVCFSTVAGKLIYKIGFYVLHCGLVVLIIGFVVTNLSEMSVAYELPVYDQRKEAISTVDFYDGDGDGKDDKLLSSVVLERGIALKSIKTETYENGQPRHYEAVIAYLDKSTGQEVDTKVLTVNHPIRYQGLKIYLMNAKEHSAGILIKSNPGEYVVIVGIVILTVGTIMMCFSDGLSFRRLFSIKKREEQSSKGKKVKTDG